MGESDSDHDRRSAETETEGAGSGQEDEADEKRRGHLDHMVKIEQEFASLKDRLYQEKVAAIDCELKRLADGDHECYLQQAEALRAQRDQRVEAAKLLHHLQMRCIAAHCAYEKEVANHECQVAKRETRAHMLTVLEERKRRLQQEKTQSGVLEAEASSSPGLSSRCVRQRRRDRMEGRREAKKLRTIPWPYVIYRLKECEIADDLALLSKKSPARHTKRSHAKEAADCGIDVIAGPNAKLIVNGVAYGRGSHIHVDVQEASSYDAAITAVNANEVWVRRNDNSKTKLYISQLRTGRYRVRPTEEES